MYRFSAVAALLLLSVSPLWADDPPAADGAAATPWYKRIFGGSQPKPDTPVEPTAPRQPITQKDVSRSLEQEQKLYLERLQFCTRLRQIATETNDNALMLKADDLEQQATQVYTKRTKTLPALLQDAKAAEAALDQKNEPKPAGTASTNRVTGHYPNGKPITSQE